MSVARTRLLAALVAALATAACGTLLGIDPDPPDVSTVDASAERTTGSDAAQGDGGGVGDGDAPVDGSPSDGAPVDAGPLLVFVSEATTGGDMRFGDVMAASGRGNADARCTSEATTSGKPGTYVAWLSTANTNLDDAIDRLPDGRAWALRSGTVVFKSKSQIPTGPSAPIVQTAAGIAIDLDAADLTTVYTGTNSAGTSVAGNHCEGWSSAGGGGVQAQIGQTDDVAKWTAFIMVNCDQARRIYCFQQK